MHLRREKLKFLFYLLLFFTIFYYLIKNKKSKTDLIANQRSLNTLNDPTVVIDPELNPSLRTHLNIILNPVRLCSSKNQTKEFIFVYVFTWVAAYRTRLMIRETWANKTKFGSRVKVAFIVGKSNSSHVNKLAQEEHKDFNDLIQGDFIDSYRNLSFKSLIAWKYIMSSDCYRAKYILKIDDDIVLNSYNLIRFLDEENDQSEFYSGVDFYIFRNSFLCEFKSRERPKKNPNSKWYVTFEEYNKNLYGINYYWPFCNGLAYLFTVDLVHKLSQVSREKKIFWIDDVYVGMLAHFVGAKFVQGNSKLIKANTIYKVNKNDLFLFVKDIDSTSQYMETWRLLEAIFM